MTLRTARLHTPPNGMLDAGLRHRPFPDDTASLLPGPLTATRTGLTPASDDKLANQPSTIYMINLQLSGRTKGHRYPVEIINHCVWLYHRFPLSFREVEELMLVRGVVVSYETIRRLVCQVRAGLRQPAAPAAPPPRRQVAPRRGLREDQRHTGYLWRAVDQHGNVLDVLVQSRRNAKAAKRFFRKLLKGLRYVPRVLVTDKLASYGVAHRVADAVGGTPAIEVSEQSGRELASADPATRTGDETLQINPARATVPVGVQRHLAALPAPSASARRAEYRLRWPTASRSGTRSPGRPPPEGELDTSFHQNRRTTRER